MTTSALDEVWSSAQPALANIRAALSGTQYGSSRIIRVGQLDSELLDHELAQLLQDPINKALSLVNPAFKARFQPELSLLIQLTLYKLSIWNTGSSYGSKLQDLRYILPRKKDSACLAPSGLHRETLVLHGLLTLLSPYLHNRLRTYALSHAWPDAPSSDIRRKAWHLLNLTESLYASLALANFITFLWDGRYRTLADRLLKMTLVSSRRLVKRDVSYEFMNRQMVWHAFTEFLLFLLPLLSARTFRRRIYRIASILSPSSLYPLLPFTNALRVEAKVAEYTRNRQRRGMYWMLSEDQCAICAENAVFSLNLSEPTNMFTLLAAEAPATRSPDTTSGSEPPLYPICNPYQTTCGHIYCYHCIAERIMRAIDQAEDGLGWVCLRCSEGVKEAHRFIVEIPESEVSESEYEFSSDLDLGTDLSGSMGSYSESGLSE